MVIRLILWLAMIVWKRVKGILLWPFNLSPHGLMIFMMVYLGFYIGVISGTSLESEDEIYPKYYDVMEEQLLKLDGKPPLVLFITGVMVFPVFAFIPLGMSVGFRLGPDILILAPLLNYIPMILLVGTVLRISWKYILVILMSIIKAWQKILGGF